MTPVAPDNPPVPEDERQPQPRGPIGGTPKAINASKLVLVVDDDPDLLDVTHFVLEGEGFGVETARNGAEALQRLRAGKLPAVVLLDLMMPVMSGYQFLEEVAKVPALQDLPIVVLTAGATMKVPGAVEVVQKPVDLRLLVKLTERYAHGAA